ncbi:MAG: hypothetical protein PHU46_18020 [Rhodocyclaceae bacterium]|nr:hypothetical protein [Rhodocyclaceae bacterium]
MRRLRLVWPALLFAFLFGALPVLAQGYDPDAEIQRLIARATEERTKASQDVEKLKAASERSKQDFLTLNDTAYQLGQTLKKVRMVDARNKAIMLVKSGLNITAVNAPEKLLEVGVNIAVDTGSETLKNNFPGLFDTSVTVELPRLAAESVEAVKRFNEVLAYSDEDVSDRLKKEVPELARSRGALYELVAGGKLNDDLIALKRAEYIINEGKKAEAALNALKAVLGPKRQELINAIKALEDQIKYLTEDIRSWERQRGLAGNIRELSRLKEPEKVTWEPNPRYDFGTAAQKMRAALDGLKAGRLDCAGYYTQVQNAYFGAWTVFSELHRQAWDANALDQFNATVRKDFDTQVTGTQGQLNQQMADTANGPAGAFMRRYQQWQETALLVPGDWWDTHGRELKIGSSEGGELAGALYGYALSIGPEPIKEWFPPAIGGLNLEGLRWPNYTLRFNVEPSIENAQSMLKNFDAMLAYVRKSVATAQQAAAEAETLARELEPHRHFWGCALAGGDLSGVYLQLKRFSPTFAPVAADGDRRAQQVHEAFQRGANATMALYTALAPERDVLEAWAKGSDLMIRVDESASRSGAQMFRNLNPYPLWSELKSLGITEAGIREISDVLPKLAIPEEAIKDFNARAIGGAGARPVLNSAEIATLTTRLKKEGSVAIANQNEYRDLYHQLASRQTSLNSQVAALKSAVESASDKPNGISAPLLLDESLYMVPNDLPDPTAGVFELLEKYAKVAAEYHGKLDALEPWTFPYYPAMEKLLKRVEQEGGGKAAGDEGQFREWWNVASQEWTQLQRQAASGNHQVSHTSPFGKLGVQVISRLMDLAGQVAQRERIARISESLNTLLQRGNDFLAQPEPQGGKASARDWINALDATVKPGSDAYDLRGNGAIAALLTQIGALRTRLETYLASGAEEMVKKFYQDFASAYQSRNLPLLLRFLASDWQAEDGSDLRDLENTLGNSFRIFDSIQVSISGLGVRVSGTGYQASYTIKLTGHMPRLKKNHEESSQVEDTLVATPDGLKIRRTRGSLNWTPR